SFLLPSPWQRRKQRACAAPYGTVQGASRHIWLIFPDFRSLVLDGTVLLLLFLIIVAHLAFSTLDDDLLFFQIDLENGPQIPIEPLPLIIIDALDHTISNSQGGTAT